MIHHIYIIHHIFFLAILCITPSPVGVSGKLDGQCWTHAMHGYSGHLEEVFPVQQGCRNGGQWARVKPRCSASLEKI